LVATHDMAAVEHAQQRIISLEFGSIVDDRKPQEQGADA
jgi:ABC-type ATPase involved in cell division